MSSRTSTLKKNVNKVNDKNTVVTVSHVDHTLLLVVILLCLIGIIMIFSAGYYWSIVVVEDVFYLLKRQIIFVVMSIGVMLFMSYFNYRMLMKFVFHIYIGCNILLILVKIRGVFDKGATRAIEIAGIQFQPLEVAKISVIITTSYIIYKNKNILSTWGGLFLVSTVVGITSGLVLLGGLSSGIIVTVIGFGIIFVASPHVLRFVIFGGIGVTVVGIFITFFSNFRSDRINAWLDPFAYSSEGGYQIINSLYAIASGGPFGIGIGQSRQKSFLPEPFNDFIFAIILEEVGYIGGALIIFLFAVLIWRGIKVSIHAPDLFGSLMAIGIVIMIASQVVINIAVVTNSMPNTGIPLPFISYGGTALIVTMFLMGVLLNISRYSKVN